MKKFITVSLLCIMCCSLSGCAFAEMIERGTTGMELSAEEKASDKQYEENLNLIAKVAGTAHSDTTDEAMNSFAKYNNIVADAQDAYLAKANEYIADNKWHPVRDISDWFTKTRPEDLKARADVAATLRDKAGNNLETCLATDSTYQAANKDANKSDEDDNAVLIFILIGVVVVVLVIIFVLLRKRSRKRPRRVATPPQYQHRHHNNDGVTVSSHKDVGVNYEKALTRLCEKKGFNEQDAIKEYGDARAAYEALSIK